MEEPAEPKIDHVRINIAFEQMAAASVAAALAGGSASLVVGLAGVFFGASLVTTFLNAMLAAFATFLIGFAGSVVVGAPLFIFLEKTRRRVMWPWLAAALAVTLAVFLLAPDGLSVGGRALIARLIIYFVPPVVFALIFSRGMEPYWRAAERAEQSDTGSNVVRFH